jgi:hypothetical protein
MKMEEIKVVVKEVGKDPEVRMVVPSLELWQGIVGGYIEAAYAKAPDIPMYINEEGKLLGLAPNVRYGRHDVICGTLVMVRHDDEGEDVSLTDSEVEAAIAWLKKNAL